MAKRRNNKNTTRLGGVSRPRRAKVKDRLKRNKKKDDFTDKQRHTADKRTIARNPARDEAKRNKNHHLSTERGY